MTDKVFIEGVKVGKDGVQLKQSSGGKEYAQFTAMWSSSRKDRNTGQREYGPTKFLKVMVFGFQAGDIAAGVQAGDRVSITGSIEHFTWASQNGERDDWTVFADSVTLPVPRAGMNDRVNAFTQQQGGFQGQGQGGPWNSTPQGGFTGADSEAPF